MRPAEGPSEPLPTERTTTEPRDEGEALEAELETRNETRNESDGPAGEAGVEPTIALERITSLLADELADEADALELAPLAVGSTTNTRIHRATRKDEPDLLVEVRVDGAEDLRAGTADQQLVADLLAGHPLVEIAHPVETLSTAGVRTTHDPGGQTLAEAREADDESRRTWTEVLWRLAFGTLRRNGLALSGLDPTLLRFLSGGRLAVVRLGAVEHVEPVAMELYGALVRAALDGEQDRLERARDDLGDAAPRSWYEPLLDASIGPPMSEPGGGDLPVVARPIERLHVAAGRLVDELGARPPIRDVIAELWLGSAPTTAHGEAEADWWKSRETLSLLDRLGDRPR